MYLWVCFFLITGHCILPCGTLKQLLNAYSVLDIILINCKAFGETKNWEPIQIDVVVRNWILSDFWSGLLPSNSSQSAWGASLEPCPAGLAWHLKGWESWDVLCSFLKCYINECLSIWIYYLAFAICYLAFAIVLLLYSILYIVLYVKYKTYGIKILLYNTLFKML
jgi:hypothetical protein